MNLDSSAFKDFVIQKKIIFDIKNNLFSGKKYKWMSSEIQRVILFCNAKTKPKKLQVKYWHTLPPPNPITHLPTPVNEY